MNSDATSSATESRNYLIFGGSGGIGTELVQRLSAAGHRMVLVARNSDRLAHAAEHPGVVDTLVADATDFEAVDQAFEKATETLGTLHGVANLVGSVLLKPAHLTTPAEFAETMALNATSAFAVIRAAGKTLRANGGSVVLMASAAARTGLSNHEAIAAAKSAVIGLTQSAAATYAGAGLRVNAIAPGLVATPLTERITSNDASLQASIAMHPLGRVGQPADIAGVLAWLLSDESSWVTGQVIGVDGGLATTRGKPKR